MSEKGCKGCRHHRKSERRKALGVADEDLELVEFDDESEVWYMCMHPKQPDSEIGPGEAAGSDCRLFEQPKQSGLSPDLEKLLERRNRRKQATTA